MTEQSATETLAENPWPNLPIPDPETCTMQQATDFMTELRRRIVQHGKDSVSKDELAAAIRCMRQVRAAQSAGKRKAAAPIKALSLDSF